MDIIYSLIFYISFFSLSRLLQSSFFMDLKLNFSLSRPSHNRQTSHVTTTTIVRHNHHRPTPPSQWFDLYLSLCLSLCYELVLFVSGLEEARRAAETKRSGGTEKIYRARRCRERRRRDGRSLARSRPHQQQHHYHHRRW